MKRTLSLLLSVVLVLSLIMLNPAPVFAESAFEISDECVALLKEMEGFDKYPRWDYSQWTVGHGTRCPDEDLERYRKYGITYEEADALLREHAATFGKSVNSFIDKFSLEYTQQQFDALLLFTYNFGPAWMFRENSSWRNGLINGVTGNDFMYEIGQWCHAGGELLIPLVKRRLIEANIFINGVYSRTIPDNYCYVIYEFNGGEGETEVQAYNSDLDAPIRVIPTREGYTFVGWYTADKGGKKITELDRSTKNLKLYARWVEGEDVNVEDLPEEEVEEEYYGPIEPVKVKVNANGVNIRSGPGTDYDAVSVAYSGDTMTITEIQYGTGYVWGKFGDNRWIALSFTDFDQQVIQKPVQPPVEPEEFLGVITCSDLRIRSGPGTEYEVVGFLQTGDLVTITERKTVEDMEWGKMESGWISMSYVKPYALAVTAQPKNVTVARGETARVTVEATGEGLTYQWYYNTKDYPNEFFKSASNTTNTYTAVMEPLRDGRRVYCVITDKYGNTVTTNTVTLSMEAQQAAIVVTRQPEDVSAANGKTAKVTVEAIGEGLTYAWYYTTKEYPNQFFKSASNTTNTYSAVMEPIRNGRRVYCVITDKHGNSVTTDTVTMTMEAAATPLRITKQPEHVSVANGETAMVTVEATGEGLTYAWYYTTMEYPNQFFKSASNTGSTYSTVMEPIRNGRRVYCVITDACGNSVTTDTVTLSMKTQGAAIVITKQPESAAVAAGETARVTVEAEGEGLTYQWYYTTREYPNEFFKSASNTTDTYTAVMEAIRDGRRVYCVITDAYGNTVTTKTVTLTMK